MEIMGEASCSAPVLAGAFPHGRPNRLRHRGTGFSQPPRHTNADPVRRGILKRNTNLGGQAALRGAHKPVANGGIMAEEIFFPRFEPGQPGVPRDRRQLLWI